MLPSNATNAVLRLYRVVTIHAGESIQLRVLDFHTVCTFEDIPCRSFFVEASSGELINLEVTPADSNDEVGLVVGQPPILISGLQRHATVRGRDIVWILGSGKVTVSARRQ